MSVLSKKFTWSVSCHVYGLVLHINNTFSGKVSNEQWVCCNPKCSSHIPILIFSATIHNLEFMRNLITTALFRSIEQIKVQKWRNGNNQVKYRQTLNLHSTLGDGIIATALLKGLLTPFISLTSNECNKPSSPLFPSSPLPQKWSLNYEPNTGSEYECRN